MNAIVMHVRNYPDLHFELPKLDKESLQIQIYPDASFATVHDRTSQLGNFIFLKDIDESFQPLYWTYHKSKRATRSVTGSGVMAFADALGLASIIKHDMK